MNLEWRNIVGATGLIVLFIWGPTLFQRAAHSSPLRCLPGPLQGAEPQSLILVGVAIVVILVIARRLT